MPFGDSVVQIIVLGITFLNGGWMLFDGLYAKKYKKYFGSDEPGLWVYIVKKVGFEPLTMAIPLIILGFLWLIVFIVLIGMHFELFWYLAILLTICTLWYAPFGTLFSVLQLMLLLLFKASILQ